MNKVFNQNDSMMLTREFCKVGSDVLPEPCYRAFSELKNPTMGLFRLAWKIDSKKNVIPLTTQDINTEHSELLNQILNAELDQLSYFEKRLLAKKLTTNFCERGFIIKVEELQDVYDACSELNKKASQLLIDVFEQEAEFWGQQIFTNEEGWSSYQDVWDN
jgi:hypothetical protein